MGKRRDYNGPTEIRYITIDFGSCPPSGLGSLISLLTVVGKPLIKKEPWVPFPIMTSTGAMLLKALQLYLIYFVQVVI